MLSYWGLLFFFLNILRYKNWVVSRKRCLNSSYVLGLISDTHKTYITVKYKSPRITKKKPAREVLSSNCTFLNMLILKDETPLCIIFRVLFHSCVVKNIYFHHHFWETLYTCSTKTFKRQQCLLAAFQ